jgi:hypothetical protein
MGSFYAWEVPRRQLGGDNRLRALHHLAPYSERNSLKISGLGMVHGCSILGICGDGCTIVDDGIVTEYGLEGGSCQLPVASLMTSEQARSLGYDSNMLGWCQ